PRGASSPRCDERRTGLSSAVREPEPLGIRPTAMTLAWRLDAVAVLLPVMFAGVVLSGCAADGATDATPSGGLSVRPPSSGPASDSPAPAGRPTGQGACHASSPATRVSLSEADNGVLVCLAR